MKDVLRRKRRRRALVEKLRPMILAASILAASAESPTGQPAAKEDLVRLTQIPATCASSDTRGRQSCLKATGTQMRRLSSFFSNTQSVRDLPILDQKADTRVLCDMVKTWADQSLDDIRIVWNYLEKHETDWPSNMKGRIEAFGKKEMSAKLATLREVAGLGKPCGWAAWGTFKTFGGRVSAGQQSAPAAVAEIAEVLTKGLSKEPTDADVSEASKAFLRAIANAATLTPK